METGPPTFRRNAFTLLLAFDPLNSQPDVLKLLKIILQMMQSGYPLRIGLLIVDNENLDACQEFLSRSPKEICPVPLVFNESFTNDSDLLQSVATTSSVFRLIQKVVQSDSDPVYRIVYIYDLIKLIQTKPHVTISNLITFHLKLINIKYSTTSKEVLEDLLQGKQDKYDHKSVTLCLMEVA
jgi:hypothetical protein